MIYFLKKQLARRSYLVGTSLNDEEYEWTTEQVNEAHRNGIMIGVATPKNRYFDTAEEAINYIITKKKLTRNVDICYAKPFFRQILHEEDITRDGYLHVDTIADEVDGDMREAYVTELNLGYSTTCFTVKFERNPYLKTITTSVNNPKGIKAIDSFFKCEKLEVVRIALDYVSAPTFGDCHELHTLELINTKEVGVMGLSHCNNLKRVEFTGDCSNLVIKDYAFTTSNIESIEIPTGVRTINKYTFLDCKHLQRVVLPNTLTDIHTTAFEGCDSLYYLDFPNGCNVPQWRLYEIQAVVGERLNIVK